MPDFQIHVVKRGCITISAKELDTATQRAAQLSDSAFVWEPRDIESCEELDSKDKNHRA